MYPVNPVHLFKQCNSMFDDISHNSDITHTMLKRTTFYYFLDDSKNRRGPKRIKIEATLLRLGQNIVLILKFKKIHIL